MNPRSVIGSVIGWSILSGTVVNSVLTKNTKFERARTWYCQWIPTYEVEDYSLPFHSNHVDVATNNQKFYFNNMQLSYYYSYLAKTPQT